MLVARVKSALGDFGILPPCRLQMYIARDYNKLIFTSEVSLSNLYSECKIYVENTTYIKKEEEGKEAEAIDPLVTRLPRKPKDIQNSWMW